jgi:His/Glu/Gln/Arg/opine family amino acid ABC transporter permease subunit
MDWQVLWGYRAALAQSFELTLVIALLSIIGSFVVGTIIGCVGALPGFFPARIVGLYVEPMRNIPAVIKLFFLYFLLGMDGILAGICALVLHHSAYIADIISSGFSAIPREQTEAGIACGHSYAQVFRYILLPQGFRIVLPSITSQFVDVVKNSAVCMFVGTQELTWQTQQIASDTFRGFEAATAVTLLYLAISAVVVAGMTMLQRYLSYGRPS